MPLNSLINDPRQFDHNGNLYVVATPIGNMEDITLRALKTLSQVDIIAAEDTRHTGRLLAHHNIKGHLLSYQEHNERKRTAGLIKKLQEGLSVALVSNAGTPSVSDPGYHLIQEAVAKGISVIPIPGVSAAVTALSVAGMPTDSFVFIGFLARKKGKRLQQLTDIVDEPRTIVIYESPRRIGALLEEILDVMGDRYAVLSREMTKLHEEFIRGGVSEIIRGLKERLPLKGECTLLVMGRLQDEAVSMEQIRCAIKKDLRITNGGLSDRTKEIAKKYGLPKNKVYKEALKIKAEEAEGVKD